MIEEMNEQDEALTGDLARTFRAALLDNLPIVPRNGQWTFLDLFAMFAVVEPMVRQELEAAKPTVPATSYRKPLSTFFKP